MAPYYEQDGISIYHGDCREVLPDIGIGSVSACITDPPYPHQFELLYEVVAEACADILEPGGSLLAIVPHYSAHRVLPAVSRHLKWRWLLAWHQGAPYASMAMGVRVHWKAIGWWVKDAWPHGRGFIDDALDTYGRRPEKALHPWQQTLKWANYCLGVAQPAGLVLDPFMGAGTTLLAAKQAGLPAIGIEIEERYCEIAAKRLAQQVMDFAA